MLNEKYCEDLNAAFEDYDDDMMTETLEAAIAAGEDPMDLMGHMTSILENIGEQFSKGDMFLPDMVMAGDMMSTGMDVLKPAMMANENYKPSGKKIVFGSVKGDVHDIGKNMVKTMWIAGGIDVVDLGVDVAAETFLDRALQEKPDIVALSATMTTTIPSMRDTIELLTSRGIRERCKILVGGGSVNQKTAESLDAYYGGRDAYESLQIVRSLLN